MGKHKQDHRKRRSFKSKHKKRAKKPVKLKYEEPDELKRAPHSFVIHRGTVGKYILELQKDFRKVMDPFTASVLQVQKKNTLKDFVSVSSAMKVSHMIIFTNSEIGPYLRIARLPQGPTLMFKIHNYSLSRDVLSSLKKQMSNKKLYTNAPLVILNNFSGDGTHIKLMASVFQNMFPTINVTKVRLSDIRRCVILNYNTETKMIDFRHYAIKAVPVGISRGVKKIVQSKIPNLAKYEDISEFLTKPSMLSESEAEDDPNSHVEVPQKLPSRGNVVSQQSSIRLSELGPRMTLQLLKVEEGLLNGEVIFHELIHKTEKEKKLIRKRLSEKRRIKEQRRQEQEANIKRKEELKEEHKQKSLEGMKRKQREEEYGSDEDDVGYFRQEVGHDPDEGVFSENKDKSKREYGFKRKRKTESGDELSKRGRSSDDRGTKKYRKSYNSDGESKKSKFNERGKTQFSKKNRFDESKKSGKRDEKRTSKFKKSSRFEENESGSRKHTKSGQRFGDFKKSKKFGNLDSKSDSDNKKHKFKRPSKLVNKIRSKFHMKGKSSKSRKNKRKN